VTINLADGVFSGLAWGENIGWISFSDTAPVAYRVQTDMVDGDAVPGNADTCPWDANPAQTNTDAAPIITALFPNDVSIANSDPSGDACDEDDDNDGIRDMDETAGCNGGANLNPANADTDGDLNRDGAECALGTNPADANSRPPAIPPGDTDADGLPSALETAVGSNPAVPDTDGDGIADGFEFRGYTTSPTVANTDGDNCNDDVEISSLDLNTVVSAADLLLVAQSFNLDTRPNFDINKNGIVQASDLLLVAQNFVVVPC
jgi:hypothetical protein